MSDGFTALHSAASTGNTEIVQLLIDNGIEINFQNKDGSTALHSAACTGNTESVQLLIANGIEINVQNKDGSTALHKAACTGNTESVQLLIANGIEINVQNKDGSTALHSAASTGNTESVQLLIDNGIEINFQNKAGNTVLHVAAEQDPEMVKSLINNNSDPNIPNDHGKRPIEVANSNVIVRLIKDYEKTLVPGLPAEVKKFDKKSARVFSSLLEEESYRHFESRVMLAGEQGTGKTTIARHLVGKQPTKFRMSTDGIELYNGLSFMDIETNCWLGGQQDFTMEELTITRSLIQDETLKKGKCNVRNKKGISQNTLDKEDTPLSASKTPEKTHERHASHSFDLTAKWSDFEGKLSNTTSRTESLNNTFRSNHHKHVNPDDEPKQLSDDQSEHKEIKENRDSSFGAGLHDSSHGRPVSPSNRSVEDSNLSDYLISVDEPNKYDLPATQEPIDTFDDTYTNEVLYDEETSTSVPDYLHSESES
ncbi:death-associated protein kinase dapk-1-like [Mytilus trossulus]|uniref:death-associated protein kinase dapk-1-like n=1 Tax=Mytilus trossulus TaxID=6551 RepID=UPI0030079CDC